MVAIDIENSIPSNATEGCENHQHQVTMNNDTNDDDHGRHPKTNHNESSSLDLNVGHTLMGDGADTTVNDASRLVDAIMDDSMDSLNVVAGERHGAVGETVGGNEGIVAEDSIVVEESMWV